MAELLLSQGYNVVGLTRDPATQFSENISHLKSRLKLIYSSYELSTLTEQIRTIRPQEIYNFAGQTYVSKSWEMLDETFRASALIPSHLLDAIVRTDKSIKFFQASSCEIFSASPLLKENSCLTESTPLAPGTPYACSKSFAHSLLNAYRNQYGIFAVSGILFHHESPRRHENFASRKIVNTAVKIKLGLEKQLLLGNLAVSRCWGYAPDFVGAAAKMLQAQAPRDLILCSDESHSLEDLVKTVFELLDLDYKKYVVEDRSLFRATEPLVMRGSSALAKQTLGWTAKINFKQLLEKMVSYELKLRQGITKDYSDEKPF